MEQNNATTEAPTPTDDVSELDNVGPKRAKQLHEKGLETIADVADIEWQFPSDIAEGFEGVKIHNQAKDIVENHTEDDQSDDDTEDELTTVEKRENINERIDELTDLINTAVEHGFDKQAHNLLDEKLECYDLLDELPDSEDDDGSDHEIMTDGGRDTTTIEIRDDQQEALSDLKEHDRESYKAVLDRLLDGDTNDTDTMQIVPVEEVVGRDVPTESVQSGPVELEATEYRKIADEVAGRLR